MPLNANWSDSEGEEEEWNGDQQKEKELKELKLKNNNITDPQSHNTSPHLQPILMKQCLPHNLLIPWCHQRKRNRKKIASKTILGMILRQISIGTIQ